jgi:hypothetical protein
VRVSVEQKRNGALRLCCEGDDCPQRFVPIRDFTDVRELRKRAELYGWTVRDGKDFCPADPPRNLELRGVR